MGKNMGHQMEAWRTRDVAYLVSTVMPISLQSILLSVLPEPYPKNNKIAGEMDVILR